MNYKIIRALIFIIAAMFMLSACGNSDYEKLKAENEALKQMLDETDSNAVPETNNESNIATPNINMATEPPKTETSKSDQPLKLTLQEVYGENFGSIETNFTIVNCTGTAIKNIGLTVDEYNSDKQLVSNAYAAIPNRLQPNESAVFDCWHKMDFNLIQYVKVSGYYYMDDNDQFYNGYFDDTEMMPLYGNWTKDQQMAK